MGDRIVGVARLQGNEWEWTDTTQTPVQIVASMLVVSACGLPCHGVSCDVFREDRTETNACHDGWVETATTLFLVRRFAMMLSWSAGGADHVSCA